jgi:hypothetical protein
MTRLKDMITQRQERSKKRYMSKVWNKLCNRRSYLILVRFGKSVVRLLKFLSPVVQVSFILYKILKEFYKGDD